MSLHISGLSYANRLANAQGYDLVWIAGTYIIRESDDDEGVSFESLGDALHWIADLYL